MKENGYNNNYTLTATFMVLFIIKTVPKEENKFRFRQTRFLKTKT